MTPPGQPAVFLRQTLAVRARCEVEGFHCWPEAPHDVEYLRHRHRHLFGVVAQVDVLHADRDVEFIGLSRRIRCWVTDQYGDPAEFGRLSCEQIAAGILAEFHLSRCEVYEDWENGAIVGLQPIE